MTTIRTPPNSPKPPSARPDLRPKMTTSKVKKVCSVTCLLLAFELEMEVVQQRFAKITIDVKFGHAKVIRNRLVG